MTASSAALDFYDDLEMDDTKSYWEAHKPTYLESVKAPMTALTEALAPEFGTAKVFRPFRDVRFTKEKSTVLATGVCRSRGNLHRAGWARDPVSARR